MFELCFYFCTSKQDFNVIMLTQFWMDLNACYKFLVFGRVAKNVIDW